MFNRITSSSHIVSLTLIKIWKHEHCEIIYKCSIYICLMNGENTYVLQLVEWHSVYSRQHLLRLSLCQALCWALKGLPHTMRSLQKVYLDTIFTKHFNLYVFVSYLHIMSSLIIAPQFLLCGYFSCFLNTLALRWGQGKLANKAYKEV